MSGTTGFIFSYALGLIFLVGGVLFLVVLSQNQVLFGVPYIVLGASFLSACTWAGVGASARRPRTQCSTPKRRAVHSTSRGDADTSCGRSRTIRSFHHREGLNQAWATLAFCTCYGGIAQLVEHTTENRGVPSSSLGLAIQKAP